MRAVAREGGKGGQACLAAEQVLQRSDMGCRSIILRLAGIYGPDRIPRKKDIAAGQRLSAATDGFLNLIHVDDAASTVLAAAELAPLPSLYNVADGHPVPRREYYQELASQLGVPNLEITKLDPQSPAAERARASKRIRSDRFRRELKLQLDYEDFRAGLAASLEEDAADS